jgi:ADP-ribosyl-[dinitrogen reductase] hydrolase
MQYAAEAARTTCQAPAVLGACRSLALALHAALSGAAKQAILEQARAVPEILPQPVPTPAVPPVPAATAPEALAAALEAFANTVNFRDAVLAAANVGGNSDVVAAVCGALAGAHYTASAIPTLWRNSLMKQQLIEGCADRLLAQVMLDFGG